MLNNTYSIEGFFGVLVKKRLIVALMVDTLEALVSHEMKGLANCCGYNKIPKPSTSPYPNPFLSYLPNNSAPSWI